jgi:peptidoglycan-N-acetylglucosamine deacetylase
MLIEARNGISDPVVALTFDDGPSPWTLPIAEHLERHGGHGTFFVLGEAIVGEGEETVRRLAAGGHEVGNHTFTHTERGLTDLGDDAIREEMRRGRERIEQVLGAPPRVWRAPFFRCDERVRAAVGEMTGDEVWHSNMPGDWELPAEETARRVLDTLQPGDIVVLHDGRPANEPPELSWPTREATVDAVALILDGMAARGLRSVTVTELLAAR